MPNVGKRKLTSQQAREIYAHKIILLVPKNFKSCICTSASRLRGQGEIVARQFNVSAKTVRDIWNHRSWALETCDLWHLSASNAVASIEWQSMDFPLVENRDLCLDLRPIADSCDSIDPFHDDWPHWGSTASSRSAP